MGDWQPCSFGKRTDGAQQEEQEASEEEGHIIVAINRKPRTRSCRVKHSQTGEWEAVSSVWET